MIISRIEGGLGNQLFQYAYGAFLARQHETQLWLDCGSYASQPAHGYLLDRLCIEASVLPAEMRKKIPRRYRQAACSADHTAGWFHFGALRRYKEREFGFHPRHLRAPDNSYLIGYWQSEQFFPGMRDELLDQFTPREPLSDQSRRISERMNQVPSAAIHVRRGDYLENDASKIYVSLPIDYYLRSLHHWAVTQSQLEVFVFSNDLTWCRQNLRLPWTTHWVDHNTSRSAHEDLWLMSRANCCVIANSTFSWWAAWLNSRPDKTIYAPANWFCPGTKQDGHVIPPDWLRDKGRVDNDKGRRGQAA